MSTKENIGPTEDTPTGGLHKMRQTPSQEVDGTLQVLDLTNQGHSSEHPTGQIEEWRQALDSITRRIGIHKQMRNNQEEKWAL